MKSSNKILILSGLLLLLSGCDSSDMPEGQTTQSSEKKVLYWVAPMDPNYQRNEAGKSPMGMDLVPVYDEGEGSSVKISPAMVQNLGVRTTKVKRGSLSRQIETVGYVEIDENMISHVHLRTEGWIEKLVVKSEGARVKKGDLLFELYSPTLVNTQDEYLQALRSKNRRLINASYQRLRVLGVGKKQISKIKRTGKVEQLIKVRASQDGIVSKLNIREGTFVKPHQRILSLADLSSIWVQVEVFERQAAWVKQGEPAEVRLSYSPGRVWKGTVDYVYPRLDPVTRTLKTRLRFDNSDESLKPNMFANITIFGDEKQNVVSIPIEALIRAGGEERVILSMGNGRFEPRQVTVGIESGDQIEILSGLVGGEDVVISAQFLLDSEASIKASMMRMSQPVKAEMTEKMDMQATQESNPQVKGKGVVRKIMPADGKLNLSHEPIDALGWPAMTMDFKLANDVSLDGLQEGTAVEFELMQGADGYEISAIRKAGE